MTTVAAQGVSTRADEDAPADGRVRAVRLLRDIARSGLASVIAGGVVLGLGGRLVMRLAAVLNPEATGRITDAGEVVGTISPNGTLALIVFGGILGGATAGVVWAVVSPWLPGRGAVRYAAAGFVALALGGSFLARSDNRDFTILHADAVILPLLLLLVAGFGWATAWLDDRLDRRLPPARLDRPSPLLGFAAVVALGSVFVPVAASSYLVNSTTSPYPMTWIGRAIALVAAATVTSWVLRLAGRAGSRDLPRPLLLAGRAALALAVIAGLVHLIPEAGRILATG